MEGSAISSFDHLKSEQERSALLSFGYVAANELGIEIKWAFHSLRRENAYLGAGLRWLCCSCSSGSSKKSTCPYPCGGGQCLTPRDHRWPILLARAHLPASGCCLDERQVVLLPGRCADQGDDPLRHKEKDINFGT